MFSPPIPADCACPLTPSRLPRRPSCPTHLSRSEPRLAHCNRSLAILQPLRAFIFVHIRRSPLSPPSAACNRSSSQSHRATQRTAGGGAVGLWGACDGSLVGCG